jgi:copper chaperone CopZ
MKTIKYFLFLFLLIIGVQAFSQTKAVKTEQFKVSGNCEMCKARIEKAAKVDGVSKAEWNVKTKVLTIVYNPAKVSSETIQKKIAAVGHDTPK